VDVETVAQMTKEDLREMIATLIEQKLLDLFGDPDGGLPVGKTLRARVLCPKKAVARGEPSELFADVAELLGLV
jgi:hypothetical protein